MGGYARSVRYRLPTGFTVLFLARQDVCHPTTCPAEALACRPGGQRPLPGSGVARPWGHAFQDSMETRHTPHTTARGWRHHIQGEHWPPSTAFTLRWAHGVYTASQPKRSVSNTCFYTHCWNLQASTAYTPRMHFTVKQQTSCVQQLKNVFSANA